MDVYAEAILDHYRHPRGKTSLPDATVTHEEVNHSCGDALTVQLRLSADGTVEAVGWDGTGCSISQAGMSMLSEELAEKSLTAIEAITPSSVKEMLGVPIGPRRFKCALLCLHTVKNALRQARGEAPQSWLETVAVEE